MSKAGTSKETENKDIHGSAEGNENQAEPSPTNSGSASGFAPGGASTTALESLREQIEKKEQSILEKEEDLKLKTETTLALQADGDDVRKELKEAQEEHAKAKELHDSTENEKKEIQPKYEHAMANAEARVKADHLRKQMEEAEETLKTLSSQTSETDAQLQSISIKYKEEREARQTLVRTMVENINELRETLSEKIKLTLTGAAFADPNESINSVENLTKDREREILNVTRQLRELNNIIAAKESRSVTLEIEGKQQIAKITQQKDDEVRGIVIQVQQERETILSDIQDVRVINKEQAFNLRRGQVQKEKTSSISFASSKDGKSRGPSTADAKAASPVKATSRKAVFRKDPMPTEGERTISNANQSLKEERAELMERVYNSSLEKADLQKSIKSAKEQAKKDAEHRRQMLRELEMQALTARQKTSQLEDENTKLGETCEILATTLKNTKQQFQALSGKFEAHHSQQRMITPTEQ